MMFSIPPGVPTELDCPRCKTTKLSRHTTGRSAYSGLVACPNTKCGFRDGVMHFIGKSLFPVEPLPPSPDLFFMPEHDDT